MAAKRNDQHSYSKNDLSFVEQVPKVIEIECPVCLQVMLTDPHLVTCCGHHFCGSCINRVIVNNGPCPMCKEESYQAVMDKERLRVINGFQVYCPNKGEREEEGCQWKGDLKNLSAHLNKGEREGECHFEEVMCQRNKCDLKKVLRHNIKNHEQNECSERPYRCQYCKAYRGKYSYVFKVHYTKCSHYPVLCPNKCIEAVPRSQIDHHLSEECSLQPVKCPFGWAGCTDKPLRKDIETHTADFKHMSLFAVMCAQLKEDNEKLKEQNEKLTELCYDSKDEINQMVLTCDELKADNIMLWQDYVDIKEKSDEIDKTCSELKQKLDQNFLPVKIKNEEIIHCYTHMGGYLISIKLEATIIHSSTDIVEVNIYIAIHEGKFDSSKPKPPSKISAIVEWQETDVEIDLLKASDNWNRKLSNDVLNNDINTNGIKHNCLFYLDNISTEFISDVPKPTVFAKIFAII